MVVRSAWAVRIWVLADWTFSTGTLAPARPDEPAAELGAADVPADVPADVSVDVAGAAADGSAALVGAAAATDRAPSAGACSTTTVRFAADSRATFER